MRLAIFAVIDPWPLIVLLALGTVPPYFELRQRGRPTRVYVLHMAIFVVLLVLGWAFVEDDLPIHLQPALASIPLFLAVLVRSGTFPAHLWVPDLFENASFGNALLYVTPITGVYAAVRLVVPVCPDWVLQGIGILSLITAVYAAGLAVVQTEATAIFRIPLPQSRFSHSGRVGTAHRHQFDRSAVAVVLRGALAHWTRANVTGG